jgi:hypothetical protein
VQVLHQGDWEPDGRLRSIASFRQVNLALEQLKALPAGVVVNPFADLSAAQLLPEIQRRIEQLGHTSHDMGRVELRGKTADASPNAHQTASPEVEPIIKILS